MEKIASKSTLSTSTTLLDKSLQNYFDPAHSFQGVTSLSLDSLKAIMKDFSQSYTISHIIGSIDDPKINCVFKEEGCPICLKGQEENDERTVVLTCKVLGCNHVVHEQCISNNIDNLNSPLSNEAALDNYHTSHYLSIQPFFMPQETKREMTLYANRFFVSIEVSHIISRQSYMKIEWPEPINSLIDVDTNKQNIFISLECFLDKDREESRQLENLPMFRAKRGKITFNCSDVLLKRSWSHQSNYEICSMEENFVFKHRDAVSNNELTLGIRREKISPDLTAYILLFLRYEFAQEVPPTPLLRNSNDFTSPASQGYHPSSVMGEASPYFLPNNSSPVLPVSPTSSLYKLKNNSSVMSLMNSSRNSPGCAMKHSGRLYDFTPFTSPINVLTLPQSHSPSILCNSPIVSPVDNENYFDQLSPGESPIIRPPSSQSFRQRNASTSPETKKSPDHRKPSPQSGKVGGDEESSEVAELLYNVSVGMPTGLPTSELVRKLEPHMLLLSKSQNGSRFIQESLSRPELTKFIFKQLLPHISQLMTDGFGHYAAEALFVVSDGKQKTILLQQISKEILEVSCHKQGSFSLQGIMDCITETEHIMILAEALEPHVLSLATNCSGHYVNLKFMAKFGFPLSQFIATAISNDIIGFAMDHYGLRVVKALLELEETENKTTGVYSAVAVFTQKLVEDQFGNYVVQHALESAPKDKRDEILKQMDGRFVVYSRQKFSSNVVEKCLKTCTSKWRRRIVRQLISCSSELINDKYGNYCLQTALLMCDKELTKEFTRAIYPTLRQLRENVQNKWVKLIENANQRKNQKRD